MAGKSGIMLCGTSIAWNSNFVSEMIGLAGLGGTRRTADATTNADTGGWSRVVYSCIIRSKPIRITMAFSPRDNWLSALEAALASWVITWPLETGYSNAGTLTWDKVGMTDYTAGGMLEERMLAEAEITPTGEPTFQAQT